MVWRLLVVGLLGFGCSADAAPAISSTGPRIPTPSPVSVGPVATVPSAETPEPSMPSVSELCFSVAPELVEAYPGFAARATEAVARWGWSLRISDECLSHIGVRELPPNANGTQPIAVHRPLGLASDGSWHTAAWRDGASNIWFSAEAIGSGRLQDESAEDCMAAGGGESVTLLSRVLTHELGHVLGLGESERHEAMLSRSGYCVDILPSETELAESIRELR